MKTHSRIYMLLARIDQLQWLWLLLAAPFLLFPSPIRSLAMFIPLATFVVAWVVRREVLPVTLLNLSLLLLAGMVLVSIWATYDLMLSLPKITGMVLAFAIYFVVARYSRSPRGWYSAFAALALTGSGIAAVSLVGTRWASTKIGFLGTITARFPRLVSGLAGAQEGFHPNQVAGSLIWVLLPLAGLIVAQVYRSAGGTTRRRLTDQLGMLATIIIFLLSLGVFILTQSRGGYLAFAITTFLAGWLLFYNWRPRFALWFLLVVLLVSGILIWRFAPLITTQVIFDQSSGLDSAFSLNSMESRIEIWSRAIYGIQDFPFTGMGMNTFRKVVHVLYPLFLLPPDLDFGHAHNEFFQAALDLGIPGLIAFIAIYAGAFTMILSIMRAVRQGRSAPSALGGSPRAVYVLALCLGGGLLAHLLYGLIDTVALGAKTGVLFWMLLGLTSGLYQQVTGQNAG